MSALVLGKRSTSSFFEELHHHPPSGAAGTPPSPPSASKRPRFGASPPPLHRPHQHSVSSSPAGASSSSDGAVGDSGSRCGSNDRMHLRSLFPDVDELLLERALAASGYDLDSAIRILQSAGNNRGNAAGGSRDPSDENFIADGSEYVPANGSDWVELLVREVMNASNVDVARVRASRLLEVLQKSIMDQTSPEVVQRFHKENLMLKEQVEELLHDNNILKRAVAIQHERQKEFDERNQELHQLKQLVAQYQENLRTLEINNYALSMHLRHAQEGTSIPGRFHPDVF
ncbi:hypothetical protein Taro_034092 [Colocasia esculenta]|uniref:CUE domain-containing protein n=1 Tax=Colocasia esculenta TaxID=4460 RepID=A0A843VWW3_COLES|nr:hypothetical protein [Colocasia esculenta]